MVFNNLLFILLNIESILLNNIDIILLKEKQRYEEIIAQVATNNFSEDTSYCLLSTQNC